MLMEIDIVQAGTAVQDAIINDKAFKMQYAKRFSRINRYAVNRDINAGVFLRQSAIPVCIGIRGRCANAPALRAMPVDQHPHVQFRTLPFSRIERVEYTFTPIVLFQIQGNDTNTLRRAGDFLQQCLPKSSRSIKEIYIIN